MSDDKRSILLLTRGRLPFPQFEVVNKFQNEQILLRVTSQFVGHWSLHKEDLQKIEKFSRKLSTKINYITACNEPIEPSKHLLQSGSILMPLPDSLMHRAPASLRCPSCVLKYVDRVSREEEKTSLFDVFGKAEDSKIWPDNQMKWLSEQIIWTTYGEKGWKKKNGHFFSGLLNGKVAKPFHLGLPKIPKEVPPFFRKVGEDQIEMKIGCNCKTPSSLSTCLSSNQVDEEEERDDVWYVYCLQWIAPPQNPTYWSMNEQRKATRQMSVLRKKLSSKEARTPQSRMSFFQKGSKFSTVEEYAKKKFIEDGMEPPKFLPPSQSHFPNILTSTNGELVTAYTYVIKGIEKRMVEDLKFIMWATKLDERICRYQQHQNDVVSWVAHLPSKLSTCNLFHKKRHRSLLLQSVSTYQFVSELEGNEQVYTNTKIHDRYNDHLATLGDALVDLSLLRIFPGTDKSSNILRQVIATNDGTNDGRRTYEGLKLLARQISLEKILLSTFSFSEAAKQSFDSMLEGKRCLGTLFEAVVAAIFIAEVRESHFHFHGKNMTSIQFEKSYTDAFSVSFSFVELCIEKSLQVLSKSNDPVYGVNGLIAKRSNQVYDSEDHKYIRKIGQTIRKCIVYEYILTKLVSVTKGNCSREMYEWNNRTFQLNDAAKSGDAKNDLYISARCAIAYYGEEEGKTHDLIQEIGEIALKEKDVFHFGRAAFFVQTNLLLLPIQCCDRNIDPSCKQRQKRLRTESPWRFFLNENGESCYTYKNYLEWSTKWMTTERTNGELEVSKNEGKIMDEAMVAVFGEEEEEKVPEPFCSLANVKIDKKDSRYMEWKSSFDRYIDTLLKSEKSIGKTVIFISDFEFVSNGNFIFPVEMAVVATTLEDGEVDYFHSLIDPGPIKSSCGTAHMEKITDIRIKDIRKARNEEKTSPFRSDYDQLWIDLVAFCSKYTNSLSLPTMFSKDEGKPNPKNNDTQCLQWLAMRANEMNDKLVDPVHLFTNENCAGIQPLHSLKTAWFEKKNEELIEVKFPYESPQVAYEQLKSSGLLCRCSESIAHKKWSAKNIGVPCTCYPTPSCVCQCVCPKTKNALHCALLDARLGAHQLMHYGFELQMIARSCQIVDKVDVCVKIVEGKCDELEEKEKCDVLCCVEQENNDVGDLIWFDDEDGKEEDDSHRDEKEADLHGEKEEEIDLLCFVEVDGEGENEKEEAKVCTKEDTVFATEGRNSSIVEVGTIKERLNVEEETKVESIKKETVTEANAIEGNVVEDDYDGDDSGEDFSEDYDSDYTVDINIDEDKVPAFLWLRRDVAEAKLQKDCEELKDCGWTDILKQSYESSECRLGGEQRYEENVGLGFYPAPKGAFGTTWTARPLTFEISDSFPKTILLKIYLAETEFWNDCNITIDDINVHYNVETREFAVAVKEKVISKGILYGNISFDRTFWMEKVKDENDQQKQMLNDESDLRRKYELHRPYSWQRQLHKSDARSYTCRKCTCLGRCFNCWLNAKAVLHNEGENIDSVEENLNEDVEEEVEEVIDPFETENRKRAYLMVASKAADYAKRREFAFRNQKYASSCTLKNFQRCSISQCIDGFGMLKYSTDQKLIELRSHIKTNSYFDSFTPWDGPFLKSSDTENLYRQTSETCNVKVVVLPGVGSGKVRQQSLSIKPSDSIESLRTKIRSLVKEMPWSWADRIPISKERLIVKISWIRMYAGDKLRKKHGIYGWLAHYYFGNVQNDGGKQLVKEIKEQILRLPDADEWYDRRTENIQASAVSNAFQKLASNKIFGPAVFFLSNVRREDCARVRRYGHRERGAEEEECIDCTLDTYNALLSTAAGFRSDLTSTRSKGGSVDMTTSARLRRGQSIRFLLGHVLKGNNGGMDVEEKDEEGERETVGGMDKKGEEIDKDVPKVEERLEVNNVEEIDKDVLKVEERLAVNNVEEKVEEIDKDVLKVEERLEVNDVEEKGEKNGRKVEEVASEIKIAKELIELNLQTNKLESEEKKKVLQRKEKYRKKKKFKFQKVWCSNESCKRSFTSCSKHNLGRVEEYFGKEKKFVMSHKDVTISTRERSFYHLKKDPKFIERLEQARKQHLMVQCFECKQDLVELRNTTFVSERGIFSASVRNVCDSSILIKAR
eukprot:g680.t1